MTEDAEVKSTENGSSEAKKVEVSKLENDIIKQLEYYFGDSNMARDKFLMEQCAKDSGWVSLDTLLTFKRLKSLSEDKKVIADAIEKSDEGLVEISEDREKLRRHPERPMPEQNEETRKDIYSRTIYVKGFPPQDGTSMNELIDFFSPYQKIQNIVMRKYHDKPTKKYLFKGSVFVTFQTKEQAKTFLEKEKLEYKETVLIRKWQDDYFEEKKAEKNKRNDKKKDNANVNIDHLPKGASFLIETIAKDITREEIKEAILKVDESIEFAFIDYLKNDESGYIRLVNENSGKNLMEKLEEGKLKVKESDVKLRLLEGDEEVEYLKKVVKDTQARRHVQRQNKKGRGNKGGRKRKYGGDDDDEPRSKK